MHRTFVGVFYNIARVSRAICSRWALSLTGRLLLPSAVRCRAGEDPEEVLVAAAAARPGSPVTPPCSPRLSATCLAAAPIHPNAPKKTKSATLVKVSRPTPHRCDGSAAEPDVTDANHYQRGPGARADRSGTQSPTASALSLLPLLSAIHQMNRRHFHGGALRRTRVGIASVRK